MPIPWGAELCCETFSITLKIASKKLKEIESDSTLEGAVRFSSAVKVGSRKDRCSKRRHFRPATYEYSAKINVVSCLFVSARLSGFMLRASVFRNQSDSCIQGSIDNVGDCTRLQSTERLPAWPLLGFYNFCGYTSCWLRAMLRVSMINYFGMLSSAAKPTILRVKISKKMARNSAILNSKAACA